MPDTNFKEQDPKRQYSDPENPKDRSGSYDTSVDFDPTEGYDNHPDDNFTADMIKEEDRFLYEEAQRASTREEGEKRTSSLDSTEEQEKQEQERKEEP